MANLASARPPPAPRPVSARSLAESTSATASLFLSTQILLCLDVFVEWLVLCYESLIHIVFVVICLVDPVGTVMFSVSYPFWARPAARRGPQDKRPDQEEGDKPVSLIHEMCIHMRTTV